MLLLVESLNNAIRLTPSGKMFSQKVFQMLSRNKTYKTPLHHAMVFYEFVDGQHLADFLKKDFVHTCGPEPTVALKEQNIRRPRFPLSY